MQIYDAQNTLPTAKPEGSKLSLDNASPKDIPRLEQLLMSLPELFLDNASPKDISRFEQLLMSLPELLLKKSNYKRMTHSAIK